MFILSQILVCIADCFYVTSMLSKNKKGLVLFLILSDILFAIHYLCLGGWTGAAIVFVDAIYLSIMFTLENKQKTQYTIHITICTILITILIAIITWDTAISLLPMFSMLIYLVGMISSNIIFVKTGALIRNTLNVIYMFILASYLGAALEICLMMSAIVGIVLNIKRKKSNQLNIISTKEQS